MLYPASPGFEFFSAGSWRRHGQCRSEQQRAYRRHYSYVPHDDADSAMSQSAVKISGSLAQPLCRLPLDSNKTDSLRCPVGCPVSAPGKVEVWLGSLSEETGEC